MVTEKFVPVASVKGVGNQDTGNGYASSFGAVYPAFPALSETYRIKAHLMKE